MKKQKPVLLLGTSNKGKVKEYKTIFKLLNLSIKLVDLNDLNIKERPKEDGLTFQENAVKKAKFYYKLSRLPTLTDDGGIEIDYLNGEPGVKSRRWPGYKASDKELQLLTLEKLKGVPLEQRTAQLRAVIAITFDGRTIYTFEGIWRGYIVEDITKASKIKPGYPFRSIFYLPDKNIVLGQLSFEEEVKIGHRMKAMKKALPILRSHFNISR